MEIKADLVKELRERTGLGLMECKKFLAKTQGNIEQAIEALRKEGVLKAAKRGDRVGTEGLIFVKISTDGKTAVMVEVNCETDFVARSDDFQNYCAQLADTALAQNVGDLAQLMALPEAPGSSYTLEDARHQLIAKIGENITVRRLVKLQTSGHLGTYVHGGRIGVIVNVNGGSEALAKDLAMHIAASSPMVVSSEQIPADIIAKEKEIYSAEAAKSGKPAEIIEKMVSGRLNKYYEEVTLVGQAFVKDPDMKVGALIKQANATVNEFIRFSVGEGLEKKTGE